MNTKLEILFPYKE